MELPSYVIYAAKKSVIQLDYGWAIQYEDKSEVVDISSVSAPKNNLPRTSKNFAPGNNLKTTVEGDEVRSRDVDVVTRTTVGGSCLLAFRVRIHS